MNTNDQPVPPATPATPAPPTVTPAAAAAAASPGVDTLTFLTTTDSALAALTPAELVDAIITSERLLAHVHARQLSLLAELGVPGRCGDVTDLVNALIDKGGRSRNADGDGSVDAAEVADITADCAVRVAAAEVAAVLDWSPITAKIRINQATRMLTALPATAAALREGKVDVGRARMITDRTAVLTPTQCGRVERRVLTWVRGRSLGQLETLVDREVIAADPAAAENRRIHAVTGRHVEHRPDKDGMGVITALLPAESAVLVFTLIDLIAQAHQGLDGRSIDQRRADVLADIADELLTHGYLDLDGLIARTHPHHPDNTHTGTTDTAGAAEDAKVHGNSDVATPATTAPSTPAAVPAPTGTATATAGAHAGAGRRAGRVLTRHGRRPHLNITGAWTTLAGLDDLPGHLDGHGAITATLLRAIAASWESVTAVAINPTTGTATALGAHTYRPGQALTDQLLTLHGTCRAAGCRMPAWRCELDHLDPFNHRDPAAGGPTVLVNQLPECKFHHLLKHHTNWTPHLQPDMSIRWTTNTGHHAISHPRQFTNPHLGATTETPVAAAITGTVGGTAATGAGDPDPADHPAHNPADAADNPATSVDPADDPATTADTAVDLDEQVILGPTVTGPTIPVHPVGTDWDEPNTDLEDPDTIPHPGSVEIHTYRALRQQAREHTLRRLAGIADLHPGTRAAVADLAAGITPRHRDTTETDSLATNLTTATATAEAAARRDHHPPPPRPHALNRPPRPEHRTTEHPTPNPHPGTTSNDPPF